MPLNTDPNALPDADYYAEMEAFAARVGDDGLHIVPRDVLVAAVERAEAKHGEDRQ